ncbi:MAG: hypothetical protein E7295_00585 [Lachnospiraceae bacterium]|nr:hypothetical protein [Lachnospiraceae bacterium]
MVGEVFFVLLLCIFLCIACYYDYCFCRIPNWVTAMMLAVGLGRVFLMEGMLSGIQYLFWGSMVVLFLYPLFRINAIGGGDVKLYAVCLLFFPQEKILSFLFSSLLIAALFSLIRFVRRSDLRERFAYLFSYVKEVADSGEWKLYFNDLQEKRDAGICMAGPILLSVLCYWGGFY